MLIAVLQVAYGGLCHIYNFTSVMVSVLHTVMPLSVEVGLAGIAAFYLTRLTKADPADVQSVFGPEPGTAEYEKNPENGVRCIAHRGAALDAPENTIEAFKYCAEQDCNFVEIDVRTSRDGRLVLLHDQGLQRLTGSNISDIHALDWDSLKDIDVGAKHPNRDRFKEVRLCLLDDALDYLLEHQMKVIIDVKGEDSQVVAGILNTFAARPALYQNAAVTSFNPFIIYQIRRKDPRIVGALSYRPYCFSAQDYDAENGPTNPRFGASLPLHLALRALDALHGASWRVAARWCAVAAVLLHKDIVGLNEVWYWRRRGVRVCGWSVNRPLEKLYWRSVLRAPYLANTLLGEPDTRQADAPMDSARREEIKQFE